MLRNAEQCLVMLAFLETVWLSGHSAERNGQARRVFSGEPDQIPSSAAIAMECRCQRPISIPLSTKKPRRRTTARLAFDPLTELAPTDSFTCRRVTRSLNPYEADDASGPCGASRSESEDQLVLDQPALGAPRESTGRLCVVPAVSLETKGVVGEVDPGVDFAGEAVDVVEGCVLPDLRASLVSHENAARASASVIDVENRQPFAALFILNHAFPLTPQGGPPWNHRFVPRGVWSSFICAPVTLDAIAMHSEWWRSDSVMETASGCASTQLR